MLPCKINGRATTPDLTVHIGAWHIVLPENLWNISCNSIDLLLISSNSNKNDLEMF